MWIILAIYAFVLLRASAAFSRLRQPAAGAPRSWSFSVLVLIPARNEASALPLLIADLKAQGGLLPPVRFLVIDDHSQDGTWDAALRAIGDDRRFELLALTDSEGKKAALRQGISTGSEELVITLDADVRVGHDWLGCIASFFQTNRCALIILPVMFSSRGGLTGRLQGAEMLALQMLTSATAAIGRAVMCNGANLAFRRSVWERCGTDRYQSVSSGDDLFLLQSMQHKGLGPIHWLHDRRAMAVTDPPSTLGTLLSQRIRWASKSGHYANPLLLFLTGLVAAINLAGVLVWVYAATGWMSWGEAISWTASRTAAEMILLAPVAWWYRRLDAWLLMPLVAVIYPWYALAVAIGSWVIRPQWKGRRISLHTRTAT